MTYFVYVCQLITKRCYSHITAAMHDGSLGRAELDCQAHLDKTH